MAIYEIDGIVPVINESAFVHESADIIGDVFIDEGVYIGPFASIRGDFGRIIIKKNANVQDCCVLHSFPEIDVILEENAHIGHCSIIHGAHIKYNAMVGMNSVIMDESVIGENAIIGASSLVPSKVEIPANHLAFGNPAKVRRELKEEEIKWKSEGTQIYANLAQNCKITLKKCTPLNTANKTREAMRCSIDYKPKNS